MNPLVFVVLSTIYLLELFLNWLAEVSEAIVLVIALFPFEFYYPAPDIWIGKCYQIL